MAIALKVHFPGTGATKAMRFSVDIPIQQVLTEIKEKISIGGQVPEASDHGLFQAEIPGKQKARWLKENHTLKFYNMAQDTEVVYKKKTRPVKVRLIDNTVKTVLIDDTAKVQQIRDSIGKKLGIKSVDEYGLKVVDTTKWLNLQQGLHEQDVKDEDTLVFDKTLFFFDDSLDINDTVQLHLIYSKSVQSILEGTYPCAENEAFVLAGIQAQIMLGNYEPEKHTALSYKAEQLLPQQWAKDKKKKPEQIANQIMAEHRKLLNTAEVQAKYKYVQTVRQLPTYGITFFTVQIPSPDKKQQKKGKMIEILLGITREKILQLDMVTKSPLREYPLVHLKRWAAVRGKFTFDFGDHEDDFWTVYTDQGDQISALIAGYIDIIINSRKQGTKQIDVDQSTGLATEESVAVGGVASYGYTVSGGGRGQFGAGGLVEGQGMHRPTSMTLQVTDISSALRLADLVKEELEQPMAAQDRRMTRRMSMVGEPQWLEQLVNIEKGTDADIAKLVDSVLSSNPNKEELNRLAAAIGSKLKNFAPLAQKIGAANGLEEATKNAAQALVDAIAGLLQSVQNLAANPHDPAAKAALAAAKQKYDAAMLFMKSAQLGQLNDEGTADLVRALTKAIDLGVEGLKFDISECEKTLDGQNATILRNMGKQLDPAQQGLSQATSVLATALLNPAARKHIVDAGQYLATLAGQLEGASRRVGASPEWLDRIGRGAGSVADAVRLLIQALDVAEDRGLAADVDEPMKRAAAALRNLKDAGNNQKMMLDSIKALAASANDVIRQALALAKVSDGEVKAHLESEASKLKEQIAELTEAGKEAIKNPNDALARAHLLEVATRVDDGLNSLAADCKNLSAAANLRAAAKAALGQAMALSQGVTLGLFLQDPSLARANVGIDDPRVALKIEASSMSDALRGLLSALSSASKQPNNEAAQEALLGATKQLGPQMAKFVASTKKSEGALANAKEMQGESAATQDKLAKLLQAVQGAQKADLSGADISGAMKSLEAADAQIDSLQFTAAADLLVVPVSREAAQDVLQQFAESYSQQLDGLQRAALGTGPLQLPASEVASAMGDLITAAEGLAGALDKNAQTNLLNLLKQLSGDTGHFLKTVRTLRVDKNNEHAKEAADAARLKAQNGVGALVSTALGQDTGELQAVVNAVRQEMENLKPVKDGQDAKAAAAALTQRTKAMQAAAQQLAIMAKTNPKRIAATAKLLQPMAKNIVVAANAAAGATADEATRKKLLGLTKIILNEAAQAVEAAGSAAVTGHQEPVEDSITRLGAHVAALEAMTTGSRVPEVDAALTKIQRVTLRLDASQLPADVEGRSRKEILRQLDSACETLAGSMSGLLQAARLGTGKLGIYAAETGEGVEAIVESALQAQAPYTPAQTVPLDPQVAEYIRLCDEIIGNPANASQVGQHTVQLGNLTKALAAGARDVASRLTGDQQKNYVNSAKALAAGVPKLVAAVKGGKPALVSKCAEFLKNTVQKMEAARLGLDVDDLLGGADTPVPPPVADDLKGKAKSVTTAASTFVRAAGQLAGDPSNQLLSHAVTSAADGLTDALAAVAQVARTLDPVKHTCQETLDALLNAASELDIALVNAGMGLLDKPANQTLAKLKTELAELLQSYAPDVTALHEKLGVSGRDVQQAAERVQLKTPQLVASAIGVAALEPNPNQAKKIVSQTREFITALQSLVGEVEVGGENTPELAQAAADRLGDVLGNVKQASEILAELGDIAKKVREMGAQIGQAPGQPSGKPYGEIKEALVLAARTMTSAATSLHNTDMANVGTVGMASKTLARSVPPLLALAKDAIASLPDPLAKARLQEATTELLDATADLISASADVAHQDDLTNRAALKGAWGSFTEAMPQLLAASKKGAQGESAIDDGTEQLSQLINKLQALAIFAQAGQDLEGVKRSPLPYDQLVAKALSSVDRLAQNAQSFSKASSQTEEQLGQQVASFAVAFQALTEATLTAADKAPDSSTQQNLINGTKAVAIAAKQLVLSAKDAQKNKDDSMVQKTLVSSLNAFPAATSTLTSLLKGESYALPQGQAPSATGLTADKAKVSVLDIASVKANASASANSVVESARVVSASATPLVFASSPESLNEGAGEALVAVQDLVAQVKGASKAAPAVAPQLQQATKAITEQMAALIGAASVLDRTPADSEAVANASANLNEGLEGLVKVVNQMPGGENLSLHNAQDIEKRTDAELTAAVEYVKRMVSSLPKIASAPTVGELTVINEKNLGEALNRAVHEIAEATQRLISASSDAEKESRQRGDNKYRADPTWANGLISAAHQVASGVGRLVNAVEKSSQGQLDEEDLVANAKHVAACVKHLYMAARTRQGVTDKTHSNISDASKAVARSTADVVKAAQQAGDLKQEKETTTRKRKASQYGSGAGGIAQKLEQQAAILRLEKQLEDARRGLLKMNKSEANAQRTKQ